MRLLEEGGEEHALPVHDPLPRLLGRRTVDHGLAGLQANNENDHRQGDETGNRAEDQVEHGVLSGAPALDGRHQVAQTSGGKQS
ncbi:MAG: hypothetical protein JWQ59_1622 [Cryobacterium sp.]|nr:hypothetical protein [Cryobacterium sp.]